MSDYTQSFQTSHVSSLCQDCYNHTKHFDLVTMIFDLLL